MRCVTVGLICVLLACGRNSDEPLRRADGSLLSSSGGEVSLADGSRLRFAITSDRYKQWEAARAGLRKNVIARFGTLLKPTSPTESSIDRAVAFLETDVTSREAIENTGMSVRDFVLMTVALDQEMRVASRSARPEPRVVKTVEVDTAAAVTAPQPMPIPDSVTPIESLPPPHRDSLPPTPVPVDSVPRDTIPPPPRDTLPLSPRDTTEVA